MQVVYLSTRPEVFATTWGMVRRFMPWVTNAVVVTPQAKADEMVNLGLQSVTVLSDESVTGMTTDAITALSHVPRNVTLRRAVINRDEIEPVFLLSDDDYRPLKPISPEFFVDDGLHVGYFCYDLNEWPGRFEDFDRAQHTTLRVLRYLDFPQIMYGAHMPQVIDRELWNTAFGHFDRLMQQNMVCEWSLYFNIAPVIAPDRFASPRPFETLCWPRFPGEWPWWVDPNGPSFENFYPELYEANGLFEHLDRPAEADDLEATNFSKVLRWFEFAAAQRDLDFGSVANPWTSTRSRRLAFRALGTAQKAMRYVNADQRNELIKLRGDVARLSRDSGEGNSSAF